MDEISVSIKPSGKVKNTLKILNLRPAYFSVYFLSILPHKNLSQQTQEFSRTSANWMYEWVLTPPSGLHTYYAIGKTNIVSDWQFEKKGSDSRQKFENAMCIFSTNQNPSVSNSST